MESSGWVHLTIGTPVKKKSYSFFFIYKSKDFCTKMTKTQAIAKNQTIKRWFRLNPNILHTLSIDSIIETPLCMRVCNLIKTKNQTKKIKILDILRSMLGENNSLSFAKFWINRLYTSVTKHTTQTRKQRTYKKKINIYLRIKTHRNLSTTEAKIHIIKTQKYMRKILNSLFVWTKMKISQKRSIRGMELL